MAFKYSTVVLLLCFLLLLFRGCWSANDRIAAASNWPATSYPVWYISSSTYSLQSHLNGTITRLGPDSEELWSFSSGSPLSSASLFYEDAEKSSSTKPSLEFNEVVVEDGSQIIKFSVKDHTFYVYDKEDEESVIKSLEDNFGKRWLTRISPEEVISRTPQVTIDGAVVLGSRSSTVFCLDGASGELIRKYEATSDTLSKLAGQNIPSVVKGAVQETLFIVRTDYSVQSLDEKTGIVRWNLSMGDLGLLTARGSVVPELPTTLASELALRPIPPFSTKLRVDSPPMLLPSTRESSPALRTQSAAEPMSPPTPRRVGQGFIFWIISQIANSGAGKVRAAFSIVTGSVLLSLAIWRSHVRNLFLRKSKLEAKVGTGGKRKKNRKQGTGNSIASSCSGLPKKPSVGHTNVPSAAGDSRPTGNVSVEPLSKKYRRTDPVDMGDGLWVGRLFVSTTVIGYGSHGTIVLEGSLDGRNVAVKRLLVQFHEKALKEIAALIETDEHPNVVRCYALEQDEDFVYVALERCSWSLNDLVALTFVVNPVGTTSTSVLEKSDLWESGDKPSLLLLQLMRDVVAGLAHLHSRNIVHRDLKPRNVLVVRIKARGWRAKLSDMGISKRIDADASSFDPHTGVGSSGWQAPEQLRHGRQTRSVDMFSLGCLLYFCITGGQHPFGSQFERDRNILHDQCDIFLVEHLPEASHLIRSLLSQNPKCRPLAQEVQVHPLFWTAEKRLSFLTAASDRVELEDREDNSSVLEAMEAVGAIALCGSWDEKLDSALIENLGKYRRYNYGSVRDLLRVIRNKSNHYRELPQNVKELLGLHPEGYVSYFTSRFPHLIMEVYKVLQQQCRDEPAFTKFFSCEH